jgi:hypothetical protein
LMILAISSVTLGRNSNYPTRAPGEGFIQETD